MAPVPSGNRPLSAADRAELLAIARRAIETGIGGARLRVALNEVPEPLRAVRATFVTLHVEGEFRGCMGTLDARHAIAEDVAWNAHAAAFQDPRVSPVTRDDLIPLDIHVSLLSPPEPMDFLSEQDLVAQLRPGVDGLVIEEGPRRGTFLPSVWEQLPDPVDFVRHLKRKAGLPVDYWSATVRISRYTVESVP
jgi:AmmeMemoRadiSam system protein A